MTAVTIGGKREREGVCVRGVWVAEGKTGWMEGSGHQLRNGAGK